MLKSAGVLLAASTTGLGAEAWVTLGALGQQTHRVWMGPTVTCPTIRYNISGQPDQRKVLDFYGKEVLPQLVG
jgi:hypothetical protein